mmetsp:Transcript_13777/g.37315  ORF Transcript_13777/g.37315 Transcript_13777/m.37315 type:complete len:817 (+) Transcript_13777:81-2531(+)
MAPCSGPGKAPHFGRQPTKDLPFSLHEFDRRLSKVRAAMAEAKLELLLLVETEDIYYLTAHQTVGAPQIQALMVPISVSEEMYFVTRLLEVTNTQHRSILREYASYKDYESGIDKVCDEILKRSPNCKSLGVQNKSKRISFDQHQVLRERLQHLGGSCRFQDCSTLVGEVRLVKSPAEVAVISQAARFCAAGVLKAQTEARPGMTETKISSLVYQGMMDLGCEYPAYPPFVCAGHNACLGHYTGAQDVLKDGETLFLEVGGCFQRYHAAMMRTCFVGDRLPPALAEAEQAVGQAVDACCATMKPGVRCKDVDAVARKLLTRPGWNHSLRTAYSIGIGFYTDWGETELLAIDPGSEQVLKEGMVLHLIPWVQIPSVEMAVGLSDTVVVTPTGAVTVFPEDSRLPRKIALIPPCPRPTAPFGPDAAQTVMKFFGTEPTPLVPLRTPAKEWGLAGVYVKDESKRLGLQAFKVFGATFAMAKYMSQRLGFDIKDINGMEELRRRYATRFPDVPITFATCTDGNHGRAVSWAAKQLGQQAKVYMPKGSAQARVAHVQANGAECTVTDLNYDDTVKMAFDEAKRHGWVVLQDTAFEGYTEIPTWIMQGYTAMACEALEQMEALDGAKPSHVFLQVGVGSLAAGVLGYLVETAAVGSCPVVLAVEPKNAACAFASAMRGDGEMATVDGDLETMIAGLACGVPSDLAWPILKEHAGGYFWIEDGLAGNGMRLLNKEGVEAGECGGAGVGLLQRLMAPDAKATALRERLGLGKDSRVLLLNTEGATDPENYKVQMAMADVSMTAEDFEFAPPLKQEARGQKRKAA